MRIWLRRLAYLLRQSRHDADLREEIEAHRVLRAAGLERNGLTPAQAADASRRAMGSTLLAREDAREIWLASWATWFQDVRYGLRALRRSPSFTAVGVVTLALGIGVNAGIFTVANAVLFRDLSAPAAHELVSIRQTVEGVPDLIGQDTFTTAEYFAYRDRTQTLSGLSAYANARGEATLGGDAPRKVLGILVSCNFFDMLQTPPVLGRALTPQDCEPAADPVVVLSHGLWRTAFAADPRIAGRTIQLNRQQVTVAGVAPEGVFNGTSFLAGGYFAPLNAGQLLSPLDRRYGSEQTQWLNLVGRRRNGAGVQQVRAELAVVAAQIDRQRPGRSTRLTIERARPNDGLPSDFQQAAVGVAAVLMTAFGLVLLIACANVANLLLARGTSRSQEIGIRVSLGASRARVVRQFVTESLLMSAAGGLLGTLVALWSVQALVVSAIPALLPPWLPLAIGVDVSPDLRVLAFAVALTVGTGLVFGLVPALHVSRRDLHVVVKHHPTGSTGVPRAGRLRATLIGVQVALCMVLMIAAGLMLRGLHAAYTIDPGFTYRDVLYVSLESVFDGYSAEESEAGRRRLLAGLEALPAVEAVATADQEPLGDDMAPAMIRLPGEDESQSRLGELNVVSEDYFSVLQVPIVRGRPFTSDEVRSRGAGPAGGADAVLPPRPRPLIVSETTARNLWPGRDPIGRALLAAPVGINGPAQTLQVVGVAADAHVNALGRVDAYYGYLPGEGSALLITSPADFATMASAIRDAARAIDPTLLLTVLPLEATLGWSRGISGTASSLFGGLGVLALVLAAVGIYGVVSYAVVARYREIGVRMALGATAPAVLGMILRQTMRPVVVGSVIGVAAASWVSGILSSVLFGVSPVDPLGLGGAAIFVLGVAFAAAVTASWPATRADPTAALRCE